MSGRSTAPAPGFREAFAYWVRLGFINFGGPAGQIAIMQRDLVERRRWISSERFLRALGFCMLLPGPEAQQLAIYVGWLLHGIPGGLAAGVFFVLPSVVVLWALSWIYCAHGAVPVVAAIFAGLKPAVVALVAVAVFRIGRSALRPRALAILAAAAFVAIFWLHVPFPSIVLAAAAVGFAAGRISRRVAGTGLPAGSPVEEAAASPRAKGGRAAVRSASILAAGAVLWAAPYAALAAWRGWGSLPALQYRFFTKAAFVTFGGAYAVLAYVMQAAVRSFHWITQAQAVDGLGLAETTPGPLIMVLQFVGFVSGWNRPETASSLGQATLCAFATSYVTFLPCFVFVFLGAPWVEALSRNRDLSAALAGVRAAVVGVILNLAVVFGAAVLWPGGWGAPADLFAIGLTAAGITALLFFDVDAVWVVLAGGIAGCLRMLVAS